VVFLQNWNHSEWKDSEGKEVEKLLVQTARPNICPSSRYRFDKNQFFWIFLSHSAALPLFHPKNVEAGTQRKDFLLKAE
jgi:hypothetical protein